MYCFRLLFCSQRRSYLAHAQQQQQAFKDRLCTPILPKHFVREKAKNERKKISDKKQKKSCPRKVKNWNILSILLRCVERGLIWVWSRDDLLRTETKTGAFKTYFNIFGMKLWIYFVRVRSNKCFNLRKFHGIIPISSFFKQNNGNRFLFSLRFFKQKGVFFSFQIVFCPSTITKGLDECWKLVVRNVPPDWNGSHDKRCENIAIRDDFVRTA